LVAAIGLLGAAGCGSDSVVTTELEGIWVDLCENSGGNGPPGTSSRQRTISFAGSTYVFEDRWFSQSSCGGEVLLVIQEAGTFVIGGPSGAPLDSTDIDFTQVSNTATPYNGEAIDLNTGGATGGSICTIGGTPVTFTDNTTVSISGASCGGGTTETANGSLILSVYSLDATAFPTTIELGADPGGNEQLGAVSPRPRPTALGNALYSKQ
jgi:hypothetical protein